MLFRLSQKLATKIKAGPLAMLPPDENPFADWSAQLFVADRSQYILLSNTKSLYSVVLDGKGILNGRTFSERALQGLREFLEADGLASVYDRMIVPATDTIRFAKALNRSVTGSMNDLIRQATYWLTKGELSPMDVGFRLNETPMSALKIDGSPYGIPSKVFKKLAGGESSGRQAAESARRQNEMTIATLLDACQFVLEDQGEPQSSYWLASQIMEMKLWRTSEGEVRDVLNKDIAKHGSASRFVALPDDTFALRSWKKHAQQPVLAALEVDLFGAMLEFHKKVMTLLRESSLDEQKLKVVADRIKTLLDSAIAEVKQTRQVNLTERLEAAYDEVRRLVEAASSSNL